MLDRLDRLVLAGSAPRAASVSTPASSSGLAGVPARPVVVAHPPEVDHITSKRGPRYVDHTACPLCGAVRVGVEFHGVLMSGTNVHQLAAHSAGKAHVRNKEPRCVSSGMRVALVGGRWEAQP